MDTSNRQLNRQPKTVHKEHYESFVVCQQSPDFQNAQYVCFVKIDTQNKGLYLSNWYRVSWGFWV